MENMKQVRQGDVFCEKIDKNKISSTAQKQEFNGIVAYGEVTGHSHKIVSPSLAVMDTLIDKNGDIYVHSAKEDIEIIHDEHGTVKLDAGEWWLISHQREYDPLAVERERRVQD